MKINLNFTKLLFVLIPFCTVLFSFILYKIIPIDNFSEISIVSATASIQFWIWFSYVVLISLIYIGIFKIDIKIILNFSFLYLLTVVISGTLVSTAMSLKGTPLASGDIRGDLLGMVDFAQYAKENGWSGDLRASGDFYPPVWPTIVGNIARILNVNAIAIYKPAEFVLLIIGPLASFYFWKKLIPIWMSLIIAIYFAISQNYYSYYWKFIPLFILVPLIIYSVKRVLNSENNKNNYLLDHAYGFILGFIILTYFGNFWWAILFMAALSFMTFFSKNKLIVQRRQTFFYIGAGLAFIPPTLGSILNFSILFLYIAFIILIALNLFIEKNEILAKFKNFLVSISIVFIYLGAFLFLRTNDDWFEGDVAKANPTLKSPFEFGMLNLLLVVVVLFLLIIVVKISWFKEIILILVGFCVSALLMRYFIASKMQVTNLVDLWPRSFELFTYAFNLIVLLAVLGSIQYILYNIVGNPFFKDIFVKKNNQFYTIAIILFIIYGTISNQLGDRFYESMPVNTFNGAWYAHKGCSNPHEDPMLAKVFESRPYIQKFLRDKCWGKNWPLVPPEVKVGE